MTIFLHELRRCRLSLLIWTGAIAFMLASTVLVFPLMAPQMSQMEDMMSEMGGFSSAFGVGGMNIARFTDYFAIECGNVMGLGGAIFAAITGVAMLSKEERGRTAEFLYTHPLSRSRIVLEKLLALTAQILILNIAVAAVSLGSALLIGEKPDVPVILLIFLANLLLQLEIGAICFFLSALMRNGIGAGLGIAIGMYFLNILSNISEETKLLKYLTPFAYTEGADILQNRALKPEYLAVGIGLSVIAIIVAFLRYRRKDIM